MSELNPCPICGCSVRVWAKRFDEEDVEYIIECDNDFCGLTYGISCGYNRDEIKKAWNSVTALSSTVSEDCVSRQSVLDLLRYWVYECEYDEVAELVEKLPPVTPKVSEDCISRQQAIEVLAHVKEDEQWRTECIDNEIRLIESLPPVTPTERTGEWIEDGYYDSPFRICSYCGYEHQNQRGMWKFCPNCGAKMKGEK